MCCGRSHDGPAAESQREEKNVLLDQGEEDWSNWEELSSGFVFCSRWRVTVSHLLGNFFGVRSRWFIEQGGNVLGKLPLLE